jgi:hypothetical protein
MTDLIVNIGKFCDTSGKFNDRIYLMKLSKQNFPQYTYQNFNNGEMLMGLKRGYLLILSK